MMISNWKNPLASKVFIKTIQRFKGYKLQVSLVRYYTWLLTTTLYQPLKRYSEKKTFFTAIRNLKWVKNTKFRLVSAQTFANFAV